MRKKISWTKKGIRWRNEKEKEEEKEKKVVVDLDLNFFSLCSCVFPFLEVVAL